MGSKPSKSGRGADTAFANKRSTLPNCGGGGGGRGGDDTTSLNKRSTLPSFRGGVDGEGSVEDASLTLDRSLEGGGEDSMTFRRRPTLGKRLRASCRNWAVARGLAKANQAQVEYFVTIRKLNLVNL
jgi:hypothetical protein